MRPALALLSVCLAVFASASAAAKTPMRFDRVGLAEGLSLGHHVSAAADAAHRDVMAFTEDRAGRLWVAAFGGGITITDRSRGTSTAIRQTPGGLSDDRVMALLTDHHGSVWAGTMAGGLNRIDAQSLLVTVYRHDPDDPRTLGAPGVMSLLEDSARRIWVGTYGGGLSRLDRASTAFKRYLPDLDNPTHLASGRVTALAEDGSGVIWVGSDGGGLHLLDPRTDRIHRFRRDGNDATSLSSDTIYALHADSQGTVWIGTRGGGLDRAVGSSSNPLSIRFENDSEGQGLPNNSVYGIRSDARGDLWLSTNYGLARLDPRTGQVRAFHRRNGLQGEEFNFGAHYRKRAWVSAGHERRVSYSNLPGGSYVLRARAANADGTWNEQGVSFAFAVAPAPWATWTAYLVYAFVLALSAAAVIVARRRKKAREAMYTRRLEEDVINRTRELAARNAELERVNQKLETASLSDPLTGLGNRRSLGHAMPGFVAKVQPKSDRFESEHMILMLIDLDRLKPINDEFGHEAGDRLLAGVSTVLLDCVRTSDKVVRWGGDEFVVVSAPLGFDGGAGLAERIRSNVVRRRFPISNSQLAHTSCSIGFARYPFVEDDPHLLSWEQTLNIADVALYRAKARRNTWIGWTGTRNAAGLSDLPGLILANPLAVVNGGLIEERTCARTTDETIEHLLKRKCS